MLTYVPLHVEKSNSFIQPLFEIKIRSYIRHLLAFRTWKGYRC
jgi:hypothetical protein